MKREDLIKMCHEVEELAKQELAKLDPKTKLPGVMIDKKESSTKKTLSASEHLSKPVPKGVDPEKYDSCVDQVKDKGGAKNAYAVCAASLKKDQYHDLHSKMKESFSKSGYLKKDDKPHPAGSPEERSHAVAEGKEKLPDAIKDLKSPGDQKKMLDHLRTLKDPSQHRSPENIIKEEMKKDGPAPTPSPGPTLNPQAVQGFLSGFRGVK
jgi:hypothetical protein